MSREKHIEERIDLSDTIDYAMRDWDDYIDECREEEIQPIDTFEEYIADYVLRAGYRKQEWISVDERLPEPQKLVLCIWKRADDGRNYGFARYQRENVWYVSNEGMPRVTHWMPLPEPPKGDRT